MNIELVLEDPSLTVGEEFAATRIMLRKQRQHLAEGRDRYRAKNAAAGLCTRCPRPAKPGRKQCPRCIKQDADRVTEWRKLGKRKSRARVSA